MLTSSAQHRAPSPAGGASRRRVAGSRRGLDSSRQSGRSPPHFQPATSSVADRQPHAKTETINSYMSSAGARHPRPDETILYTLTMTISASARRRQRDTIFNGRSKGTGTEQWMQGRALPVPGTERSVVVLASREEKACRRRIYVAKTLYPLPGLSPFQHDSRGVFAPRPQFVSRQCELDLLDALTPKARGAAKIRGDPRPGRKLLRSDHFALAKAGVTAISWRAGSTWSTAATGGHGGPARRISAKRYHQRRRQFCELGFTGIARTPTAACGRPQFAKSADTAEMERRQRFRAIRTSAARAACHRDRGFQHEPPPREAR